LTEVTEELSYGTAKKKEWELVGQGRIGSEKRKKNTTDSSWVRKFNLDPHGSVFREVVRRNRGKEHFISS